MARTNRKEYNGNGKGKARRRFKQRQRQAVKQALRLMDPYGDHLPDDLVIMPSAAR